MSGFVSTAALTNASFVRPSTQSAEVDVALSVMVRVEPFVIASSRLRHLHPLHHRDVKSVDLSYAPHSLTTIGRAQYFAPDPRRVRWRHTSISRV